MTVAPTRARSWNWESRSACGANASTARSPTIAAPAIETAMIVPVRAQGTTARPGPSVRSDDTKNQLHAALRDALDDRDDGERGPCPKPLAPAAAHAAVASDATASRMPVRPRRPETNDTVRMANAAAQIR